MKSRRRFILFAIPTCASAVACAGAEEPARVELPVTVDPSGMTQVQTDLGYDVQISEARLVVEDLQFTIAGEAHVISVWQRLIDRVIPAAHAHPGHSQGGDVTGELSGHFVLNLLANDGAPMGMATLIVGKYESGNFTFGQAGPSDELAGADALLGHTAMFVGQASQAGTTTAFSVVLDAPPGRQLVGAPFDVEVSESSAFAIGFVLMTRDPLEGDTLFDAIDFGALPPGAGGAVVLSPTVTEPRLVDAYETVRRTFQTHDHFNLSTRVAD